MKKRVRRILSVIAAAAVTVSCSVPVWLSVTAENGSGSDEFENEHYAIDFEKFSSNGEGWGDPREANGIKIGWSLEGADGEKHLRFTKTAPPAGSESAYIDRAAGGACMINLNETGAAMNAEGSIKLTPGGKYRVKMRFQLSGFQATGDFPQVDLFLSLATKGTQPWESVPTADGGWHCVPDGLMVLDGLTADTRSGDGNWIEKTYVVTAPDNADQGSLLFGTGYIRSDSDYSDFFSPMHWASYDFLLDGVQIDRVEEVTVHGIDPDGGETKTTYYGAPGDYLTPDNDWDYTYYRVYNAETGEFSDPITPDEGHAGQYRFTNRTHVDIYYLMDHVREENHTIDFEGFSPDGNAWGTPYTGADGKVNGWSLEGEAGSKRLHFTKRHQGEADGNCGNAFLVNLNETGAAMNESGTVLLTPGGKYTVKMRYKLSGFPSGQYGDCTSVSLFLGVAKGDSLQDSFVSTNSGWSNVVNGLMILDTLTEDTKSSDDGWIVKTYTVTVPADAGSGSLLFGAAYLNPEADYGFSVHNWGTYDFYLDEVQIDRVPSFSQLEKTSLVLHTNGAAGGDVTEKGFPGDYATLPIPVKDGHDFAGWYRDEALTQKAGTVYFPDNGELHLYARWIPRGSLEYNAIMDFERLPYDTANKDSVQFNANFLTVINSGEVFAGDQSLQYRHQTGQPDYFRHDSAFAVYNRDGQGVFLKDNTTYMLHFWYKAGQMDRSVRLTPMTGFRDGNGANYWADGKIVYDMSAYIISPDETGNDWKQGVMTFTTGKVEEDPYWGYDQLFLQVNVVADADATIYLDNITVTEVEDIEGPEKVDSVTDFEDVPYTRDGEINNNLFTVVESGWKSADDHALRYKREKGQTEAFASFSAFGIYSRLSREGIRLTDNTGYKLTFRYKADSLSTAVRVEPMASFWDGNGGNFWVRDENVSVFSGNGYTIVPEDADGEWKTGTLYFTTGEVERDPYWGYNMLFLCVNVLEDTAATVYFDDITLRTLAEEELYISEVYTSDKNVFLTTVPDGQGGRRPLQKGDTLELGVPTTPGYAFSGWYEDSTFTKPIPEGRYMVNSSGCVYAKWRLSYAKTGFERYPDSWKADSLRLSEGMSIAEDFGYQSGGSLRYRYDGSADNYWAYAQLHNPNDIVDLRENPLIIEKGQSYKLSFQYYVAETDSRISITPVTASRTNCWAYKVENYPGYIIKPTAKGTGWQRAELVFTADPMDPQDGEYGDALYLKITAGGKAADIYVDDVELTSLGDEVYIAFEANNGSNQTFVTGKPGSAVGALPTPSRAGHTFAGWYTDEAFSSQFTSTVFAASSITLYAKWQVNDSVTFSFEDEYYRNLQETQHDCAEASDDMATDGRYSMKVDKTVNKPNRTHASLILSLGEVPFRAEKGATYAVTFDYYVQSTNIDNLDKGEAPSVGVLLGEENNLWAYNHWPEGSYSFTLAEETGIWRTGAFMFTADYTQDSANVLYFRVSSSPRFCGYFDNVRLTKVTAADDTSAVLLDPAGASSLGGAQLLHYGHEGDTVNLPTTLTRKGHVFTGWYRDRNCTDAIQDNIYTFGQVNQTLYAGWANQGFHQGFETFPHYSQQNYHYMDFDYEICNSADKAHSGSYSLHRIGKDHHNAAAQIISKELNARLSEGQIYKITMYVRLEEGKHSDGAVAIACTDIMKYAWAVAGEWKNIIAVKDLQDHQWHKVEYTFLATGSYLSIRTPGYLDLYIDDISFELLENAKPEDCSKPVECTEYIPKRLDEGTSEDITKNDIDTSLLKMAGGRVQPLPQKSGLSIGAIIAIVAAAVVVAAGAAVLVVVIVKRRKRRNG